jgi:chromosome segregation ATPase
MGLVDSLNNIRSRIAEEDREEDEIETDEESLQNEIRDVLDKEDVVKEELSYDTKKTMNYYPQGLNHTKEIVSELDDAESKVEEVDQLAEEVEKGIYADEKEIMNDVKDIEDMIQSIEKVENRIGGLFSDLERILRKSDPKHKSAAEHSVQVLEEQKELLTEVRNLELFQRNENRLYPTLGYMKKLAGAAKKEQEKIKELEDEVNELEDLLEHLEFADKKSGQLVDKEQSLEKVQNSEIVKHTKEAVARTGGEEDRIQIYHPQESVKIVQSEADKIKDIETRTEEVADMINSIESKIAEIKDRDRIFVEKLEDILSALESLQDTLNKEIEEAQRFRKLFLTARQKLQEAKSQYQEEFGDESRTGLNSVDDAIENQREEVSKALQVFEGVFDEEYEERFEEVFDGEEGVIQLLEDMKEVVDKGVEEAETASSLDYRFS